MHTDCRDNYYQQWSCDQTLVSLPQAAAHVAKYAFGHNERIQRFVYPKVLILRIPTHQMSKYFLPLENQNIKRCFSSRFSSTPSSSSSSACYDSIKTTASQEPKHQLLKHQASTTNTSTIIMASPWASYVFSNDTSACEFRRAVRRQVASRHEYAIPAAGPSAQEVQQAYFRFLRAQNRGIRSRSTQQAPPPPYTAAATIEQAGQDEQAPPPYTATIASATPTAQLNTLLYNNVTTPPSPPEYSEVAAQSPPNYDDVIAVLDTATTSRTELSSQNINTLFAGCTTRTPRKKLHRTAIQALGLVVGSDGPALPPRPSKKGFMARMKGKI